ncbi:DinB family protein [Thermogemmatispora onikobensis]|uniref:DinB family protein n=1 Tax=Thermogemmatispora onikobensis TaxID=732234 RepID=UPI0008537476|nr:DinB family protein [Thermogemmatispora onikobensis]
MNTEVSRSAPSTTAYPDRSALCAQLEETRLAFHALVASLSEEVWHSKHTASAWTVRELLSHIVDGLAHAPDAIDHARHGKPFLNLPPFLHWLTAPANFWLSKWHARGQTRQTILARYDAAHQVLLHKIEGIRDDEWSRGAPCYGEGYKTVLDLCVLPIRHLSEHAAQLPRAREAR